MNKPTILIVEDDGILAIHLEDLLTRQGYLVLKPVPTGEKAILAVIKAKPDLVLMDIELAGDMNGITAAEEISAATDTPVIFLTGFSQDPLLQQAKIAAPYGYLVKPVPERELAATIEMALYKHKIDHQIKVSEAKYRSLIEQAADGIFLFDKDGNYLEVNSAGCKMLGYTRGEILKMNLTNVIAPEHLAANPLAIKDIQKGTVSTLERIFVRKEGSQFPVEISAKILDDGNLQGIIRDITERKQAEAQIKLTNERFRLAVRGANLGVWDWDISQNSLVWDDGMYQLYGIKKENFGGAHDAWLQSLHPDDVAANNAISEQARRGEREYDTEFRVIWPDGSIHWLKALGQIIQAEDGTPIRMTGVNFDITAQKELENEARRNEKRLRSLLEITQYEAKNTQGLLDFALEKAIQLTESKIGYIYFYNENNQEFTLNTWSKELLPAYSIDEQQSVYQLEKTAFWGEAVRQRRAILDNNFQSPHTLKKGYPEGHVPLKKFLTIPVFVNQAIVAVVGVANKTADYDAFDELQLSLMMDSVWKIVEQTIADENLRLESAALNAAANAIVITNQDGIIEWANPAFTTLTGYTLEDSAGKNPRDLVKSGQHPREFYQNMWDTILAGQVWFGEMINRRKDGTLYYEEMTITPVPNPEGEIKQFIAIKQNITERKKAEAVRHQLEEKFTKAFHTSPDAISITRLVDGKCIEVNEGFCNITGYTREEVIGKTSAEIPIWTNLDDRDNFGHNLSNNNEVSNLEILFRIKNGRVLTCLLSSKVLEIDGEVCSLSITHDISDRKEIEQKLRYSEERYRLLFEEMAEGFALHEIILDENQQPVDYRFLDINPAFEKQTGLKREDVIDRTVMEVLPQTEDYWIQSYGKVALTGNTLHYENYSEALDKWFKVTAFSPKFGQFAVTFEDITERHKIYETLKSNEHLLNQIFEILPAGLWIANNKGDVIRSNPAGRKIWGVEQMVGMEEYGVFNARRLPFGVKIAPDDWALDHTIKDGVTILNEMLEIDAFDNQKRIILNSTAPVLDEKGEVEAAVIVNLDVTDWMKAETALVESEARYRSLFENAPIPNLVEDFSEIGALFTKLRSQGVTDMRSYFESHPEVVSQCAQLIKILDVNQASIDFFKVTGKEDLFTQLPRFFTETSWPVFREEIIALAEGAGQFECDISARISTGEEKQLNLKLSVDPGYSDTLSRVNVSLVDVTERNRTEQALEKRVLALTQPLESSETVAFEDLFNLDDIQKIQDEFAQATGVASIITRQDGTPITRPSNFCRLCNDIIRKTEIGQINCFQSDAVIGRQNDSGPIMQPCMSGGLWDAGAGISVGGHHVANWLIGQVRDETQTPEKMREYAREIGTDEEEFIVAFQEVTPMSQERFQQIANALFTFANQLSTMAFQNVQQARFISDRKRAEEALEQRNKIFTHSLDMLFVAGFDGMFKVLNPAWHHNLGWSIQELLSKPWLYFVHPDDKKKTIQSKDRNDAGLPVLQFENRYFCKDGSIRWLSWNAYPYPDEGIIIGVARDVTETKKADEALKISEEKYHLIDEASQDLIYSYDRQGRFTHANSSLCRMLGLRVDEIIGKTNKELGFPQDVCEEWIRLYQQVYETNNTVISETITPIQGRDPQYFEVVLNPIHNDIGEITGIAGTTRDINARKQAENKIQEQVDELRRWHENTLGREMRIIELKDEVNQLLKQANQPPRYAGSPQMEQQND